MEGKMRNICDYVFCVAFLFRVISKLLLEGSGRQPLRTDFLVTEEGCRVPWKLLLQVFITILVTIEVMKI